MVTSRNPDATRQRIIDVASTEMRENGYKAASLSVIINKAGISKGALYHHFTNKQALGYTVFEENFMPDFLRHWQEAISQADPIAGINQMLDGLSDGFSDEELACGCPVNTLSQEMSGEDEGYRLRTLLLFNSLQKLLVNMFDLLEKQGRLKEGIAKERSALFIVSSFQGMSTFVKASRDRAIAEQLSEALKDYINSLIKTP